MKKISSVRISFRELEQMDEGQLYAMVKAVKTYCENGHYAGDTEIARLTDDPVVARKFDKYRRRIDRAGQQSRKARERAESVRQDTADGEEQPTPKVDADGEPVHLPVEMRAVVMFTHEWVKNEITRLYCEERNYSTLCYRKFLEKFLECIAPYMPPYLESLQLGAERGDFRLQHELGECYERGRRVPPRP